MCHRREARLWRMKYRYTGRKKLLAIGDGSAPAKEYLDTKRSSFNPKTLSKAEWLLDDWHIIPLARQVVAILEQLQQITGDGRLLFPSLRSKKRPISNNIINAALRRIGFSHEPHIAHLRREERI